MRTVGFIDHPAYKVTVFSWAEKYIVKIEAGFFEQAYKFRQEDFTSWDDLKLVFDDLMFEAIRKTFMQMSKETKETMIRYQNKPRLA